MGIKSRLAEQSQPVIPNEETLVYKEYIGNFTYWIITTKLVGDSSGQVNIHRWYFPHPRLCENGPPKYVRGPGFYIPSRVASSWRNCTEKLLSITADKVKALDGYYQSEIKYGTRYDSKNTYHNVRFFVQNKKGSHFFQIQDFVFSSSQNIFLAKRHCIYTHMEGPKLLHEFIKALTWAENKEVYHLEKTDDAEIITFPDSIKVDR